MGRLVLESRWMPRPLGWVLIVGGVELHPERLRRLPHARTRREFVEIALSLVATVGEFWMIGYLLIFGVRRSASLPHPPRSDASLTT